MQLLTCLLRPSFFLQQSCGQTIFGTYSLLHLFLYCRVDPSKVLSFFQDVFCEFNFTGSDHLRFSNCKICMKDGVMIVLSILKNA